MDLRFDNIEHAIRLLAEGMVALEERMNRRFDAIEKKLDDTIEWAKGILQNHERRITTLERSRRTKRRRH